MIFRILSTQYACDNLKSLDYTPSGEDNHDIENFVNRSHIAFHYDASQAICDLISHQTRFNSEGFHNPNHRLISYALSDARIGYGIPQQYPLLLGSKAKFVLSFALTK